MNSGVVRGGQQQRGVICMLEPGIALPAVAIWLSVILLTRYVGLSTMSVAIGVSVYIRADKISRTGRAVYFFSIGFSVNCLYTSRKHKTDG